MCTFECMWHVAIRWENMCRNHRHEAGKPHVLNHGSFLYCGVGSERGWKSKEYSSCCLYRLFNNNPRVVRSWQWWGRWRTLSVSPGMLIHATSFHAAVQVSSLFANNFFCSGCISRGNQVLVIWTEVRRTGRLLLTLPTPNVVLANILITDKMHFIVYDVLYSQCSHQHVSAATAAIFRVMLLSQYKGKNMVSCVDVTT